MLILGKMLAIQTAWAVRCLIAEAVWFGNMLVCAAMFGNIHISLLRTTHNDELPSDEMLLTLLERES